MSVRQKELKRSEIFRLPWVEEVLRMYWSCCYPGRHMPINERYELERSRKLLTRIDVVLFCTTHISFTAILLG